MAPRLSRPRLSEKEKLSVQGAQTHTMNGQEARKKLEELEEQPGTSKDTVEETPVSTPAPVVAPAPAASSEPEPSAPVEAVAPPVEAQAASPEKEVSARPTPPATSTTGTTRRPGRPSRAAVAAEAATLVNPAASGEDNGVKGVIHLDSDSSMQLRLAILHMASRGKRKTMKQLTEESIVFYLDHLREVGELPK